MKSLHRRGMGLQRTIAGNVGRMLESLESRVLLSGNTYAVGVYSFTAGADGAGPFGGLVADTLGNLFGTTEAGGTGASGSIYELPINSGTVTALHGFTGTPDGANSYAGMVIDKFGNLFGTTYNGGASGDGTVFEIPAGTSNVNILYSFSGGDGANPYDALLLDSAGDIFGTTVNGGLFGKGTVFEIPSGQTFVTLRSFNGITDGATPFAGLTLDAQGDVLGTTYAGGSNGDGTVFEISHLTFSTLYSFAGTPDGAKPTGQLMVDGGVILGTTSAGGTDGDGTIFGIDGTGGTLTTVYSFTGGTDGSTPFAGLVMDAAGDLFGTTYHGGAHGNGTVYEIRADSTVPQTLHAFTGGADGATPYAPILVRANGELFGTTTGGGANGHGTIFVLAPTLTSQITVAREPGDIQAGGIIKPSVIVDLKLSNGNINTADNSSVTLTIVDGPANATLMGTTTVQAINGVATFSNLELTTAGTITLAASDGSLDAFTMDSFVVNPGPAAKLVFSQEPAALIAGQTFSSAVTVSVTDAFGNVTTDNSMVTVKLASAPAGAVLGGTLVVQASDGIATFGDLSLTTAGSSYMLAVTDGKLPLVKSTAFIVSPDVSSAQLTIARQPGNTVVGHMIAPGVLVDVTDRFGNLITSDTSQVTANLVVVNLAGGATSAALTGTTTVKVVKGLATFGNLAISVPGQFELQMSDGGLAALTSGPLENVFIPTHLVFTQEPAQMTASSTNPMTVVVSIEDASNRIDTTDDAMVTIALKGIGTLSGTLTVPAVDGVATFNDLLLTKAGGYSLTAAAGTLTHATSANFSVLPDFATSHLVIEHLPANNGVVGKVLAPNLVLAVEDQFGNVITTDHSAATISVNAGPGGGTISGVTTVHAIGGVVTFANLDLHAAGVYSLQVVDTSLAMIAPVLVAQTVTPGVTSVSGLPAKSTHTFGQTITLTADFRSTAPATIAFTGMATLNDNGSILGTATLSATGAAKFTRIDLPPGGSPYQLTVSYPGDAAHTAVTSSAFTLVENLATTTTALTTSSNTLVFGQPITLTAAVHSTNAPNIAETGSVSFYDGATLLGTVALNGNAMASLTLTPSTVGNHAFKVVYSGDADFKTSTSAVAGRMVNKDKTTLSLVPGAASPIATNQTFNLNVQLSLTAPGAASLAGDLVTIKDNGKALGTLTLDGSGDATLFGLTYTTGGLHTLTVVYAGDADTLAVTSSPVKITIT